MSNGAKRILFVDDDRVVLQGLARMLFEMDDRWEMVFADSSESALRACEGAHFDVIVSDARMPEMDGVSLLARVRADHPDVMRIILTGHAELDATLRAIPVAHSFASGDSSIRWWRPWRTTMIRRAPARRASTCRRSCMSRTLSRTSSRTRAMDPR